MIDTFLATTEAIAVFLIAVMAASTLVFALLASLIGTIADWYGRSRNASRGDDSDLPDPLLPPCVVARRAGEDDGAARLAGPGGAPDTAPTVLVEHDDRTQPLDTVRDTAEMPPIEIDSPDSARGAHPSGLPMVRIASCPACYDGLVGTSTGSYCSACGRPLEGRRLALRGEPDPGAGETA